jgi:excinuclease UvrABC nuclease subunit
VRKAVYSLEVERADAQADAVELLAGAGLPREDVIAMIRDLEREMKRLSRELAFEDAARVRDRIIALRKRLSGEETSGEDDADVALAIAAAPRRRSQVSNWRRTRRGP